MTPEDFCDLAIQAITNKDARVVLEDKARELDWFDEKLSREILKAAADELKARFG